MTTGTGSARQKPQPIEIPDQLQQPETSQLEEQIRLRAHEIWLGHAGQGGRSAMADWLQAQEEILNEIQK